MGVMKNIGCAIGFVCTIIFLLLSLAMISVSIDNTLNESTDLVWNNGVCADCETRFELRGVDNSHKYYACPDCGQEVRRH